MALTVLPGPVLVETTEERGVLLPTELDVALAEVDHPASLILLAVLAEAMDDVAVLAARVSEALIFDDPWVLLEPVDDALLAVSVTVSAIDLDDGGVLSPLVDELGRVMDAESPEASGALDAAVLENVELPEATGLLCSGGLLEPAAVALLVVKPAVAAELDVVELLGSGALLVLSKRPSVLDEVVCVWDDDEVDVVAAILVTFVEVAATELLVANEFVDMLVLGTVLGAVVVSGSAALVELSDAEVESLARSDVVVVATVLDTKVVNSVVGSGADGAPLETAGELAYAER